MSTREEHATFDLVVQSCAGCAAFSAPSSRIDGRGYDVTRWPTPSVNEDSGTLLTLGGVGASPSSKLMTTRDAYTIADGYHRLCADYSLDEDALIPCKII